MCSAKQVLESLLIVRQLMDDNPFLDDELLENKEAILYQYNTLKLQRGDNNPFYQDLRKHLGKTFKDEIAPTYNKFLQNLPVYKSVLDLGCGDGSYLLEHLNIDENMKLIGVDNRNLELDECINFLQFDLLGGDYSELPDAELILANEFFHLFSDKNIENIFHRLQARYKGKMLVITENIHSDYLDERLKRLSNGRCLRPFDISDYFTNHPIIESTKNHYILGVIL